MKLQFDDAGTLYWRPDHRPVAFLHVHDDDQRYELAEIMWGDTRTIDWPAPHLLVLYRDPPKCPRCGYDFTEDDMITETDEEWAAKAARAIDDFGRRKTEGHEE